MGKVLIVDDSKFMHRMLGNIIEKEGHEIVANAYTGKDSLQVYKDNKPDLVTMDITMPDMDGIEATKRIINYNPSAKIIMCSAMGQKHMVMDAIEAGAKDFIVKPIKQGKVAEVINDLI